ncbi:MAG: helix-turn-helix domain-containing protein [Hyphomicrobiales bacterium]|nr:MAG: helix-turn-helix domain-containing protein [Hyphomicrobiales bacterium]
MVCFEPSAPNSVLCCAPPSFCGLADRCPSAAIARALRVSVETVRKWRGRWNAAPGVASLGDAKRSGRPPKFTPVQVTRVKAMACTPRRSVGCRWRGGRVRNWPAAPSPTGSVRRSRRPRFAGGSPRTPSSPGSISRGSSSPIRTSPPKLAVCSTCMPGCGMGNRWASTTM